ncbi:MAG: hypothetical protein J6W80_06090, partial [Kiritimatiellae bacterium]|nr:hypothetical protein [Kiritimatiellia bacterium]
MSEKTVSVNLDVDSGLLTLEEGTLFVGEMANVEFAGYEAPEGGSIRLTIFARDKTTPLADNSIDPGVLDLRSAELRTAYRAMKAPRSFWAVANEVDELGDILPRVLAVGWVQIQWSAEVFDTVAGSVATMKGDKGEDGEDGAAGKSAYQIAVENGYTGTEAKWANNFSNAFKAVEYNSTTKRIVFTKQNGT